MRSSNPSYSAIWLSLVGFDLSSRAAWTRTGTVNVNVNVNVGLIDAFSPPQLYRHIISTGRTTRSSVLNGLRNDNDNGDASPNTTRPKRVVVIGGGWAGYSFCESISTNTAAATTGGGTSDDNLAASSSPSSSSLATGGSLEITLLDASAKAKGGLAGGYRTEGNRPAEAGIHGFWREYRNTIQIMGDIEGVEVDSVLGDFTPSVLFSKNGKVAVAPVLGSDNVSDDVSDGDDDNHRHSHNDNDRHRDSKRDSPISSKSMNPLKAMRRNLAANLPPPLDLPLLAEFNTETETSSETKKNRLQLIDFVSAIGLLGAWADFNQESPESWNNYDSLSATELFRKAGVTEKINEELVSPLLHVLPMCPAYDCSAAAALSCFHVFALQSRGAFDVRWCRGSISELIFEPWQLQLEKRGVQVRGGSRVTSIEEFKHGNENDIENDIENCFDQTSYKYSITLDSANGQETIDCDSIVMAVGATSMSKISASSPLIGSLPAAKNFDKLRGVTCVAVRLFLKPHASITSDLNGGVHSKTQLPPDVAIAMKDSPIAVCGAGMGGISALEETGFCVYDLQRMHDEFSVDSVVGDNAGEAVAVLEVDFYRADDIANMNDDEIANLALDAVSAAFNTRKIHTDEIVDKAIVRARNAVSHFAPKSALYSPGVKLGENLYVCGDWIDRMGHASWSTEKAVVTAKQAAAVFSKDLGLTNSKCNVIPAAKDTPQLTALRQSARLLRSIAPPETAPPSPWVFAKQLLSGEKII